MGAQPIRDDVGWAKVVPLGAQHAEPWKENYYHTVDVETGTHPTDCKEPAVSSVLFIGRTE